MTAPGPTSTPEPTPVYFWPDGSTRPQPPPTPKVRTNGFAVASLVLALPVVTALLGLVSGIIAHRQLRRSGDKGRGLATAAIFISALWLALGGIVGLSALAGPDRPGNRDPEGQLTDSGPVLARTLQVGDCLESLPAGGHFSAVSAVPCSDPHVAEVYAVVDIPGDEFPGIGEAQDLGDAECPGRLAAYSATASQDPSTEISYFYPTADGWGEGNNQITCIVVYSDPQTESIRT